MSYPSYNDLSAFTPAQQTQLQQYVAYMQGYLSAQHKQDGSHSAITADSVTVAGPVTATGDLSTAGNLTVESGTAASKAQLGTPGVSIGAGQSLNGLLVGGTSDGWALHRGLVESPGGGTGSVTQLEFVSLSNASGSPMAARALRLFYDIAAACYALEPIVPTTVNLGSDGTGHRFGAVYSDGPIKGSAFNGVPVTSTTSASFNDGSAHSAGTVFNQSGWLTVTSSAGSSTMPFWANGGSGVSFKWTYLDPDTGWVVNTNGSFSFSDAAATNTYTVAFNGGTGDLSVTRTAGTAAYTLTLVKVN